MIKDPLLSAINVSDNNESLIFDVGYRRCLTTDGESTEYFAIIWESLEVRGEPRDAVFERSECKEGERLAERSQRVANVCDRKRMVTRLQSRAASKN